MAYPLRLKIGFANSTTLFPVKSMLSSASLARIAALLALLSGCGKPDHSGVYVFATEREVTMVQIVQSEDGQVTGRVQSDTINQDGTIARSDAAIDGAISGNELVLKPTSPWFGGINASGAFEGDTLTLTAEGGSMSAKRTSLSDFQRRADGLKAIAADKRRELAAVQARSESEREEKLAQRNLIDRAELVSQRVIEIRSGTVRLSTAIEKAPDFAGAAATNTAKIGRLARTAPTLSDVPRGQLSVAAHQIEIQTNQILIQRDQYAANLSQMSDQIARKVAQVSQICTPPISPQLVNPCTDAEQATRGFQTVYERARSTFKPLKTRIEAELREQQRLLTAID